MLCRRFAVLVLAACALAASAPDVAAQERYLEIAARHSRARALHQAVIVPDAGGRQAVITFRIPNSLLVFTQEKNGFEADVEVSVELQKDGRKVDERIWRRKHAAATFDDTQSRTKDLEGSVQFDVTPGDYTYRLIVDDGGSSDRGTATAFNVPPADLPLNGSLLFGTVNEDSAMVNVDDANLGGDVPFGQDLQAVIPISGGREKDFTYQLYQLSPKRSEQAARRLSREKRDEQQSDPVEIRPDDKLLTSGSVTEADLIRVGAYAPGDADCMCWSQPDEASSSALAVIDLDTGSLENGAYVLDIRSEGGGASKKYVFRTLWREMPLSLYDVEVAIRNLQFIEDREAIRGMLKGSREQQVEAFRAYWDQRDPTPNTVRNELMEEYYRRVDDAAVKFRTGQHPVPDGLRTDPARIYILYGEPDRISHTLPPSGGVEETWTYDGGRTFTFWAASSLAPLELIQ